MCLLHDAPYALHGRGVPFPTVWAAAHAHRFSSQIVGEEGAGCGQIEGGPAVGCGGDQSGEGSGVGGVGMVEGEIDF